MDLSVEFAGIELKNPVVLASGTAGYGLELEPYIDLSSLGGVILKSVTLEPRVGNLEPRIWETTAGMLNSIGLENIGVDALLTDILPRLAGLDTAIIASIAGETVDEYAALASRLDGADGIRALEINVSCPNVQKGGVHFCSDPEALSSVVAAVREKCSLPVIVKLAASVMDLHTVAWNAERGGASALSVTNTIPALAVDPLTRRSRLGSMTGGLSGPAIKPIALKAVWDCFRFTGLPILGGGGIFDVEDALEFLVAGASAVTVGTAIFQDPTRPAQIVDQLPGALERVGVDSVRELVGTLKE